jgi:hypothetical protein
MTEAITAMAGATGDMDTFHSGIFAMRWAPEPEQTSLPYSPDRLLTEQCGPCLPLQRA